MGDWGWFMIGWVLVVVVAIVLTRRARKRQDQAEANQEFDEWNFPEVVENARLERERQARRDAHTGETGEPEDRKNA